MRYAGIKNKRIFLISDKPIDTTSSIIIPKELDHIASKDLVNCKVIDGQIIIKNVKKDAKQMKIALVSNYGSKCGIGTYSKFLYDELIKHIGDYKIFAERNDSYEIESPQIPNDKIEICWKRGENPKELIKAIKDYNPDIVWIQHEYGLWPNARYWLYMLNQLSEYRIIATMHSIFHHRDKTIIEAAVPEIIVHLQGAVKVLKEEKHISGKVYMIPHGCFPCKQEKLWNFYKSDHTFIQFGFGLSYKSWESSIKTVAILKEKFPDVFFTGLFSEAINNKSAHDIYYNELMDLVEELGVQENVALIRGFQSDETLDSYLRTNRASLFPYASSPEHEVYGASGAARMAMSKGLPVITTRVNHFEDVPSIKADTPEQMAKELEKIFINSKAYEAQIKKQIEFLNNDSWANVALKHIKIFES